MTPNARWSPSTLRDIAGNPRYAGKLVHAGEVVGDAAWPPIIDQATHDAVRAVLEATARPRAGRYPTTLLGGIVRCGLCQVPMSAGISKGGQRVYRCNPRQGGCGKVGRDRGRLDDYVTAHVLARVGKERAEREYAELEEQISALADRDVSIDLDLAVLADRFARRAISAEDYYRTLDALRSEQRRVRQEYRAAVEQQHAVLSQASAREDWESWTIDQRRAVISRAVVTVLVFPAAARGVKTIRDGEVRIEWR
jgi:hypothetical protein